LHEQLANEIKLGDGHRGLVISASKEIEPGARAMLLLADGLFRLDVLIRGDSLQPFVRNLTDLPLEIRNDAGGLHGTTSASGEAASYSPGRADLLLSLGSGEDLVKARVTIGTLRFAQRGTIRVSAQAIVRHAAGPAAPAAAGG
jgi:hypothetical protein